MQAGSEAEILLVTASKTLVPQELSVPAAFIYSLTFLSDQLP